MSTVQKDCLPGKKCVTDNPTRSHVSQCSDQNAHSQQTCSYDKFIQKNNEMQEHEQSKTLLRLEDKTKPIIISGFDMHKENNSIPCSNFKDRTFLEQSDSFNVDPKQIINSPNVEEKANKIICSNFKDRTFLEQSDSFNVDPKQIINSPKVGEKANKIITESSFDLFDGIDTDRYFLQQKESHENVIKKLNERALQYFDKIYQT